VLKLLFLIVGLAALVGIVLHIGLEPIQHTVSQLGPLHLGLILLPMILVYGLEAFGWQLTLDSHARKVGFMRLFAIRMAGETVNVIPKGEDLWRSCSKGTAELPLLGNCQDKGPTGSLLSLYL